MKSNSLGAYIEMSLIPKIEGKRQSDRKILVVVFKSFRSLIIIVQKQSAD